MHIHANPARFLKIAHPLTAWLGWSGVALIALGPGSGLLLAPGDYLQGDSVRYSAPRSVSAAVRSDRADADAGHAGAPKDRSAAAEARRMNHWPFVIAAYAVTLAGTGGLVLWSWSAMRRAEREGEELKR